jgi:galactokinase
MSIEEGLPLPQLAGRASEQFERSFGKAPHWIVAAPGRVNLIGEHTDYNDGFVLPMAIDRYAVLAAGPSDNSNGDGTTPEMRVYSASLDETRVFDVYSDGQPEVSQWSNYIHGVVAGCVKWGMKPGAIDAVLDSNVPLGGGLSSSAAIEVATATLMEAIAGDELGNVEKALLCQKAEHEYAGVPCGIMDQFTSVMGQRDHLMLLDCRSTDVKMVPLSDPDVTVLIINTNVKHELTGGEYAERRSQCEAAAEAFGVPSLRDAGNALLQHHQDSLDEVLLRRARHVISEIDRTTRAAEAIEDSDWAHVGQLMYASHESLRDDYEVSCEELDVLVQLAREVGDAGGVIGSRMTGGGFGGCTVSLVRTDKVDAVVRRIHAGYLEKTGIEPTLFTSRPARGAHVLQPSSGE